MSRTEKLEVLGILIDKSLQRRREVSLSRFLLIELTFARSKVPERTAGVLLLSPCRVVGSHGWCWSHSAFSPLQTSVRRSVVSEEYLTTNIHHAGPRLDPLVLKSSLASCSSAHSPRPLHFQVGTFSLERRPLDTLHQSGARTRTWASRPANGRPGPRGTLQSQ